MYTETVGSGTRHIGPVWRFQSAGTFYHARLRADLDAVQVYSFNGGSASQLAMGSATIATGTQYALTVDWDADSGEIDVYLDDEERASSPLISLQDTSMVLGR